MSADEDEAAPATKTRRLNAEDSSALWWLAHCIALPVAVVLAIFYAEPLFRSRQVDVVPTVLRQEVHPIRFRRARRKRWRFKRRATSAAPIAILATREQNSRH